MRYTRWNKALGAVFLVAVLSVPAWSANADRHTAMPGTLNYVEGQASIGDQALDAKAVGSAQLQTGQTVQTGSGKAEVLLTPGVYLRLGNDSSAKMVSPNLTNTLVALDRGRAMVEVDQLYAQNDIRISQPGGTTRLLKTGLYEFDAANKQVKVFDGKADVVTGDRDLTVKGGHYLALNTEAKAKAKLKAQGFDKKRVEGNDDLYRWSSLRSQYLAEANIHTAGMYYANGWYGPGWFGPGWYWDPWFGGFTFLPADGFLFSPFGFGFFSPLVITRVPVAVTRGPHHFDSTRPLAIGSGFHNHAVRSFGNNARVGGFRSAPMHSQGSMNGFHSGSTMPPPMHR